MPTRGHRAQGGITRTHSRTSSGGGTSKLGLNLQFTQKEPLPPKIPDKSRKNAYVHHEPNARTAAPYSRTNSAHRIASKDPIPPQLRRAPPSLTAVKTNDARQKVNFRISSPTEGDDDEWVSSESGAATPNSSSADSDAEATTPVEPNRPALTHALSQLNGFHREDVETPKAEIAPLPPAVEHPRTRTPEPPSPAPTMTARDYVSQQAQIAPRVQSPVEERHDQRLPQAAQMPEQQAPPVTKAHSETHSPPRTSSPSKRQSMTRPPSTRSITRSDAPTLRPHPLIRGHSYGHGVPFTAISAPLAPLAMVSSDAAHAQMSTASSPTSLRSNSPSSIKTASVSPSQSSSSTQVHRQLRRTSTSSTKSTATLPVQSSSSQMQGKVSHDRQRTLSTISSSSSFAALSNLAYRSTPSPPRTPIHVSSRFPPAEQSSALENVHPLLPPPYYNAHFTVLAYRNPLAESYDRIIRAKQAR